MGWLHSPPHNPHQLAVQYVEVGLVTQLDRESFEGLPRVVFLVIDAPIYEAVALYCVTGNVKVVSEVRGLHVAGSFVLSKRVGMGRAYPQPVEFTLGYCRHLHYRGSVYLHQRGAEGSRTPELRRAKASASHCRKPRLAMACCVHTPSVPSGLGMRRTVRSHRTVHSRSCRSICEDSRGTHTPSGETARGFPRHRTWMHISIIRERAGGVKQ